MMSYDVSSRLREFPSIPLTSLDQIIAGKIRPA